MRGDGKPKRPRSIVLNDEQVETLEAISAVSVGKPSTSALVRDAVDSFIVGQLALPRVQEEIRRRKREAVRTIGLVDSSRIGR